MPITLNGTTGVVTPGATVGSITGILKASSGVVAQAVAGSDYGQLTLATAQTASGTAVDFTGIPSWAKRITVIFNNVSFSGISAPLIRLGTSSGIVSTGYNADSVACSASNALASSTVGHIILGASNNGFTYIGSVVFNKFSGDTWIGNGMTYYGAAGGTISMHTSYIALASTLTQLRITTVNGTDTFDAGTINISYE